MSDSTQESPEYVERHLVQAFANDSRLGELELDVHVEGDTIEITGRVATDAHCDALVAVAAELYPTYQIRNMAVASNPEEAEQQ